MTAPSKHAAPEAVAAEAGSPSLAEIVEHTAHLLPSQAPLHAFVHHNTLHGFEHLPFEDAVVEAAGVLDTEPFQRESQFAEHIESGRIKARDVEAAVAETIDGADAALFPGGPTRAEFRCARLQTLFEIPHGHALRFLLEEGDVRAGFHPSVPAARRRQVVEDVRGAGGGVSPADRERHVLHELWAWLASVAPPQRSTAQVGARRRDQLLAITSVDTDELVHPLLIRLCAAFLDQGIAYWQMPDRSIGFLRAVRRLYGRRLPPLDRAFRGLADELRQQEESQWSAEETVAWALAEFEVPAADHPAYVRDTLLALRGWAGMMRYLEVSPDAAPVEAPPASLMDFLAVRLVLDVIAARNVLREHLGAGATFRPLREAVERTLGPDPDGEDSPDLELVFEAFVLAQHGPLDVSALADPRHARRWLDEVKSFDEIQRRSCLHQAYERRHRIEVLDGVSAHCRVETPAPPAPKFQASFCIDDREESLRRHLEECFPEVETFGYAGFFGVAMNYQGMEDVRPRPLCPPSMSPKHLILERGQEEADEALYRKQLRRLGGLTHSLSVGSKTMTRGGALAVAVGLVALIPVVLRSLFPRLAGAWAHTFQRQVAPRPSSRLMLERSDDSNQAPLLGYTVDEMSGIVTAALRTMSLVDNFCSLVLMVGHGSSSLNNPHEAAHDCGATGGGRGGPNARAFAAMANHPEVRAQLAEGGIDIPDSTWFVGGYHNTCDDAMTYYDEDLVPASHRDLLATVKRALAEACTLDAHERCRRFETTPAKLTLDRAMDYARVHAADLAEPRPEYGHATNAVCIVGRRERTRGLFLDRRAFLVSYDPVRDPSGELLTSLLLSVGPVGAGINLEYYFSYVDPVGYGCGTKLPHNITGLIGVMDGHASDLRTGLPWQMVEIHEPVRLLTIVEAKREVLAQMLDREPALAGLVGNSWIQLVAWDPDSDKMSVFRHGQFHEYRAESDDIPIVRSSADHYRGRREHLAPAHIQAAFGGL